MSTPTLKASIPAQKSPLVMERLVKDLATGTVSVEAFCSAVHLLYTPTEVAPLLERAALTSPEAATFVLRAQRRLAL